MRTVLLGDLLILTSSPVLGQDRPAVPDPATITLPDMSSASDPKVAADGWKYFYFHKQGVAFDKAYADFEECYRFLPASDPFLTSPFLPMFVPWEETPGFATMTPQPRYGLVGAAIGSLVMGPLQRRASQSRMRRCLEPRGYVRYPLAKGAWEQLIDNYSTQSIALQAKAAAGPRPNAEVVTR